jgi:hypothetical protein
MQVQEGKMQSSQAIVSNFSYSHEEQRTAIPRRPATANEGKTVDGLELYSSSELAYLSAASNHADLERRLQQLDAGGQQGLQLLALTLV